MRNRSGTAQRRVAVVDFWSGVGVVAPTPRIVPWRPCPARSCGSRLRISFSS
jgi:hypothetical protein